LLTKADQRRGGVKHLFPVNQRSLLLDDDAVELVEVPFVVVVNEVAARAVRTQTGGVIRLTQVGLVLGMTRDGPQFGASVSELTLVAVLAGAVLLERSTQLRLVAAGLGGRRRGGIAGAAVHRTSLSTTVDARRRRADVVDRRRGEQ